MAEFVCRGLPGSWLNAWLAAVGSTVLDDRLRLHWTTESSPVAVLSTDGPGDPIEILSDAWPTRERIDAMPIACDHDDLAAMKRTVLIDVFVERARAFRRHPDAWTLSSTVTDLGVYDGGEIVHAPLDPPGPGTIKWLHHRLIKVHGEVDKPDEDLRDSFSGSGKRVKSNGLGFDLTRLTTPADVSEKLADPVIEVLAFFGLALLPVRSTGVDMTRPGVRTRPERRQRGWRSARSRGLWFERPAWEQTLDSAGIDALLDAWHESRATRAKLPDGERSMLGVHAAWRTIGYQTRGSADNTVGYGSEHI